MAELKTKPNEANVAAFLDTIADPAKRADAEAIIGMMRDATQAEPKLWGPSIVGFGEQHYKYATGREGDWFLTGFSPRKQNLTLYLTSEFDEKEGLLAQLGKHSTGKSCLYIKRLSDVNTYVLRELITRSVEHAKA